MRVVEDDTKTEDAVPYWKINDFLGFAGFSWVRVVFRAPRPKKAETKRFYLQRSVPTQPKTNGNFAKKNLQKLATTLPYPHCSGVPRALAGLRSGRAFRGCGVETFTMGMGHFEHCNLEKRGEYKGTLRKGQACSAERKKHRKTSKGKSNFQERLSGKSCSIFRRHFGSSSRLKTWVRVGMVTMLVLVVMLVVVCAV